MRADRLEVAFAAARMVKLPSTKMAEGEEVDRPGPRTCWSAWETKVWTGSLCVGAKLFKKLKLKAPHATSGSSQKYLVRLKGPLQDEA